MKDGGTDFRTDLVEDGGTDFRTDLVVDGGTDFGTELVEDGGTDFGTDVVDDTVSDRLLMTEVLDEEGSIAPNIELSPLGSVLMVQ